MNMIGLGISLEDSDSEASVGCVECDCDVADIGSELCNRCGDEDSECDSELDFLCAMRSS